MGNLQSRFGLIIAFITPLLFLTLCFGQKAEKGLDSAPSWEVFRGNPSQNASFPKAMQGTLKIKWKTTVKDSIESTAAASMGNVYVGSLDEHLYCFDIQNGKTKWAKKCGPIKAPIAIQGETIYAGDVNGDFHALDAKTGKSAWTFSTKGEISGGACFFNQSILFGSQDEHLYSLGKDGKEKWKFRMDGPFFGSCAIAEGKTFAAGCDSTLHVLDAATGKEIHSLDLGGQTGATAALKGESLFIGTMSNQVLGINWKKPSVHWTYTPEKRAQPFFSSCAISEELIIIGGRDKKIHALKLGSGQVAWEFLTDGKVDGSPLILGDRVICGSSDGILYVLELSNGKLIQKLELGGSLEASPIVAASALFIGNSKGDFFCIVAD